jgi:hypothetical protein
MALIQSILALSTVVAFCFAFGATGDLILRLCQVQSLPHGEHFLISVALGVVTTEVLLFFVALSQRIRLGCFAIVLLLFAIALSRWKPVWSKLNGALETIPKNSASTRTLLALLSIVVFIEFSCAMAPLTGSDALHYHFASQKTILQNGFHPIFSNSHSFLCGQHHLLILFGLALGSERLALGFIFLGGLLTTTSLACLTFRWASVNIALIFSLLFLVTPVVFWQISTSGAPDIYIAFLAVAGVLVLSHEQYNWQQIALAGFLVGGIAGAKYTGCLIAVAFLISVALETKSVFQMILFTGTSLASGIWLYLRNFLWTGDPVFPFFSEKLTPHLVTAVALADLVRDTGGYSDHSFSRLVSFLFLAAARKNNPGLWDFFGPTVFALAPLLLLAVKNTRAWRVPLLVWSLSTVGIFYFSGLGRFLLPIFPIALSCVAAGWEASRRREWKIASITAAALVVLAASVGAAGLLVYSAKPILASSGFLSATNYLQQSAPDYQVTEAINQNLAIQDPHLRTLVFFRHTYYLSVPYLNANPDLGFEVDPSQLQTPDAWKQFFEEKNVGFVVRSPDYPKSIELPLLQMERDGDLMLFKQVDVENFAGKRFTAARDTVPVVILKVKR